MRLHDSDVSTTDEALWLAVRYVLDELPPGETVAFERRLATEQSLRDSLVQATRLVSFVAATAPQSVPQDFAGPRHSRRRTIVAACVATAAMLLVGIVFLQGRFADRAKDGMIAGDDVDPARLVVLWSRSAESLSETPEFVSLGDDASVHSDADPNDALLPPDWMLAAVEQETLDSRLDGDDDAVERN